jgi:hypothetical protein
MATLIILLVVFLLLGYLDPSTLIIMTVLNKVFHALLTVRALFCGPLIYDNNQPISVGPYTGFYCRMSRSLVRFYVNVYEKYLV